MVSLPLPTSLADFLTPELAAHFAQSGDLPPTVRANLATELRRTLVACAAYLPKRLVQSQMAAPMPGRVQGAFWQGSLLFADLSGFTTFSEKLSFLGRQGAEEVSAVVNHLFAILVTEVVQHHGELLKFGGDALTAFFDAELLGDNHAAAATSAALALQAQMQSFAAVETRAGTFRLALRVGVHSGWVFAAEVGDCNHIELFITGSEFNRVAFAQEIAAPGEVVISEATAALIKPSYLTPRKVGFHQITALEPLNLPLSLSKTIIYPSGDDLQTLEKMANQITALRPYLLRGLPRRFLDASTVEVGEFRPVSVLFANVRDFNKLIKAPTDDPAQAVAILNAYFRRAQEVVHRYDGVVNKVDMCTQGDKLMVLFGAPVTHEDDPLRAVRCALELEVALAEANTEIEAIFEAAGQTELPAKPFLKQQSGINTGSVFAGRVGGAQRYEYTVMGQPVNLAARLMSVAPAGAVWLSPATRAAVEQQVALVEQNPVQLKGITAPLIPTQALYTLESKRKPVPGAETSLGRPPLIGRSLELALLEAEALEALKGAGRVLALVGEAGIGKTRLTDDLIFILRLASGLRQAQSPSATASGLRQTQSPSATGKLPPTESEAQFLIHRVDRYYYDQNTPYITLRTLLYHLLGFAVNNQTRPQSFEQFTGDKGSFFNRLQMRVDQLAPQLSRFTPVLSDVFGITLPETTLTQALTPEQRHERVQELVVALLLGAATKQPLLLVIEDLQWADASSLELLARLAKVLAKGPFLLLLNYRPSPPIPELWANLPTTTRLTLDELSRENSAALLAALLDDQPPSELRTLLERTQGNPFFIEELVRSLIASGTLLRDKQAQWQLTRPIDQVAVPNSIEGLIMARLDQLDEPRYELVQTASVIGQRFHPQVLEGVYQKVDLLAEGLQSLTVAELIIPQPTGPAGPAGPAPSSASGSGFAPGPTQLPDLIYHFRHALLREVAYETILYARRRDLHRRVAERIEELVGDTLDEHLGLLARHYLLAEMWDSAFHYHLAAAIQAQERYANREALALFATALEIAPSLRQPALPAGPAPSSGSGSGSVSGFASCVHLPQAPPPAFTFAKPRPHPEPVAKAKAKAVCATLLPHTPLVFRLTEVYERSGNIHLLLGEYEKAQTAYINALSLVESEAEKAFDQQLLIKRIRLHKLLAKVQEHRSEYDAAFSWLERGMALANTEVASGELVGCYLLGASIYQRRGEHTKSLRWARLGLSVAENTADQAHALLLMGNCWREQGEFGLSIPALEEARGLFEKINDATLLSNALNNLGEVYYRVGRWRQATTCHMKSSQISESIGDVLGMAQANTSLAVIMANRGELTLAEELYRYSGDQFRSIGSLLDVAITEFRQGEILLLGNKPQAAFDLLQESITKLERIKARIYLPEVLRLAAEAVLFLGDSDQAVGFIARSLAIAGELGMVMEEAVSQRVVAQIALVQKNFLTAKQHLELSHIVLERLKVPYELGKIIFWQAELAYALGKDEQAAALVAQARQIFSELGARRDLERVCPSILEATIQKEA